jgi:expansin (peptidoglycan-binding protein)
LGACGINNVDTDFICAVSEALFDSYPGYTGVNPNDNPVCGRMIQVNYQGKSVTVKAVDRCTGCQMYDIDMTPSAFQSLADPALGRIDITWEFL